MSEIESKVYNNLKYSLKLIHDRFLPVHNKLSPKVAVMQWMIDIFPEKEYKDQRVENNGFINFHLCIDAQTEVSHTEHDSSYTIIAVPQQKKNHKPKGNNKRRFELVINESKTAVIHMHPGIVFSYLGYMLTLCQQITVGTEPSIQKKINVQHH